MADPRTFVLIGDFQDNITPALESINKTINSFKQNMASMATKKGGGYGDVTQSVGKLVSAQKHLKEAIEGVGAAAKSATQDLKDYKSMLGKVSSAHYHIQKSGTSAGKAQSKFWQSAEKDLDDYKRKLESLQRQTKINPYRSMPSPDRGRGGGGRMAPPSLGSTPPGGPPRPPRGGGGGGGGMSAHMAEFGFAYTLGSAISQPIQNAIVSGFQIGIGMMTKPFQYFVSNFGERMQDEMSDLKAAGGFFSISREQKERGEKGFVDTFRDAVTFTQENNRIMDKMAATLPGVTEDYVEVSKRISDSVARLVTNDSQKAAVYAESIRKAEPQYFKDMKKPITSMTGEAQQKASIQAILADLTKSTVLAGQGGRAGAGGARGAYGLPQLTERMLSEDEVSLGQFQRYAAVFSDPMIMSALQKEIPNINKSAKNTVDRAKAIKALFERVLPPELIAAYRRTMSGITEGFRTALVGKESGLFGLGRPLEILVKEFDEFGNVIKDEAGKIKQQRIGLYNFIRDMAANLGQVFQPIVENITLMYDPLTEIGKKLVKAREFTYKLLESFNFYLGGFEKLGFEGSEANLRASLTAIADLLRYVGAINITEFSDIVNKLKSKDVDFGAMMSGMLDKLLNSKAAFEVGKTVGDVVGTVITEVSKATGFISGRLKSSNQLLDGLKKGFNEAGGVQAFKNIFKDVFGALFKVLWDIFKPGGLMPLEGYMLIGAMVVLPAAVQGLGMLIAEKVLGYILRITATTKALLTKCFANAERTVAKGVGASCMVPDGGGRKPGKPGKLGMPMSGAAPVAASSVPTGLVSAPSSVSFRPVGPKPPEGFEHIALPGKTPDLTGGVVAPGRAPSIPAPVQPLKRTPFGMLSKLKGKGAGAIAAGMITLSSQAPALAKAGKSLVSIGKNIPVLGLAFAGLDFGLRKAGGQDTATAAGGAAGAGLGGAAGAALGSLVPVPVVGTVVGSILGSMLGSWIGENLVPIFNNIKNAIQTKWTEFTTWLSSGFNVGKFIGQVTANLQNAIDEIGSWFSSLPGKVNSWFTQARVNISKAFADMAKVLTKPSEWGKLWTAFATGFTSWVDKVKNSTKNWFKGLLSGFKAGYSENRNEPKKETEGERKSEFLEKAKSSISDGWKQFSTWFSDGFNSAWNNVKATLSGKWNQFSGWFSDGITSAWNNIKTSVPEKWNQFSSWFSDGITSAWNNIKTTLSSKWEEFSGWFLGGLSRAWESLKSGEVFYDLAFFASQAYTKVQEAVNSIIDRVSRTWDKFTGWVSGLPGKLQTAYSNAVAVLNGIWTQFTNWVMSLPGKLQTAYSNAVAVLNGIWARFTNWMRGLPGKLQAAYDNAVSVLNGIWTQFTSWVMSLPGKLQTAYSNAVAVLNGIWAQFTNWVMSLPGKLQTAYSNAVAGLNSLWYQFTSWVSSLPGKLRAALSPAVSGLQQAWSTFTAWFSSLPGKLRNAITTAFSSMGNVTSMLANGIRNWLTNAAGQVIAGWKAGQQPNPGQPPKTGDPKVAQAKGSPGVAFGSLGAAVSYEQQHKPAGSDLVVANTSETIIPAAGGYGMKDFMSVLTSGFSNVNQQYTSLASGINTLNQETTTKFQQADTTNADRYQKTTSIINNYHKQNQQEFAKIGENILQLSQKVATMSSMGGMLGGMGGDMALGGGYGGAGVQIAGQLGNFIKQTGGAPGSIHEHPMHGGVKGRHAPGSYHYSGRAIDIGAYANEQAGVIARIKQFNAQYGVKPVEFLHAGNDPNHRDHVHVAYANGLGNPIVTPTKELAQKIDAQALGKANVKTYTAGKGEFGGETNITTNITINQQPGQDADELASIVAMKISEAVSDARAASIFV